MGITSAVTLQRPLALKYFVDRNCRARRGKSNEVIFVKIGREATRLSRVEVSGGFLIGSAPRGDAGLAPSHLNNFLNIACTDILSEHEM